MIFYMKKSATDEEMAEIFTKTHFKPQSKILWAVICADFFSEGGQEFYDRILKKIEFDDVEMEIKITGE